MAEEQENKIVADELKARLDYCRSEDRHECVLINNRMQWMLACQGFLLAAYFVLSRYASDNKRSLIIAVICIFSARIAWIVRHAIKQAEDVIEKIHCLEGQVFIDAEAKGLGKYFSGYNTGRQWGRDKKDFQHINSFRCQSEIPWGFVVIWAVLFLVSIGPKFM